MLKKSVIVMIVATLAHRPPALGEDAQSRILVDLPAPMRGHMFANMRDHLLALAEIQEFLGAGAFDKAAETAENRLGMSSLASHNAAHMAQFMPKEMQDIGSRMHASASRFALIAQESTVDGDAKRAIAALSDVTRQCVACHAAYRVQ